MYVCKNCYSDLKTTYVESYIDTGHELHHIACPECGCHTVVDGGSCVWLCQIDDNGETTVGTMTGDCLNGLSAKSWMGETVTVHTHDCNGIPVNVDGRLIDIHDCTTN